MTTETEMDTDAIMERVEAFRDAHSRVRDQLNRIMVGQENVVEGVLISLFAGGHVLLEGMPGLGKTLLIRSLSQALRLDFNRVQFTPDLMPADVTGTTIVAQDDEGHREFRFQRGPIFSQILLADEINRATPKTQSAMLEAMQERSVTVAGTTHMLDKPFFVMATQNPIEQEGTYPLPEAQLDRFFFKLLVGLASREQMHEILNRTTTRMEIKLEPVLDGPGIVEFQKLVRQVLIAPHVQDYAIRAVLGTHNSSEFATPMVRRFVRHGASPRAAQTLVLAGKVRALLDHRVHVSVDDLKRIMQPAIRHRILLNFEAQAEGITPDMIIDEMLDILPVESID
ncbi:MAG: AAA family ATPase [Phycisphaeraceae bacterium]|nr:AAA family ATPase [Phycisphaeraceae bacterium]